jgi:hypothetical protein
MNEAEAKAIGVVASQEPCAGTAQDGQWMAQDMHGRSLCVRPTQAEALRVGVAMAEQQRMAVCGRIG